MELPVSASKVHSQELERIRESNDGILRAEDVVAVASEPTNPLHECFEWDDGEAAHQYRIEQARKLIRVCVTVLPYDSKPIRTYVSMQEDRHRPGGGYRTTESVLSNNEKREKLLDQAEAEFRRWEAKYRHLTELESVFAEMNRVRNKSKAKARKNYRAHEHPGVSPDMR